jgi:hypothetical protein
MTRTPNLLPKLGVFFLVWLSGKALDQFRQRRRTEYDDAFPLEIIALPMYGSSRSRIAARLEAPLAMAPSSNSSKAFGSLG